MCVNHESRWIVEFGFKKPSLSFVNTTVNPRGGLLTLNKVVNEFLS